MNDRIGSDGRLRVLFVCALNQWRSPTAEQLYKNDARLEVRSAGIRSSAPRRVSRGDLEWADVVFVMDPEQQRWIMDNFREIELPKIRLLEVSDGLPYMHPQLQEALRTVIDPEIEAILTEKN